MKIKVEELKPGVRLVEEVKVGKLILTKGLVLTENDIFLIKEELGAEVMIDVEFEEIDELENKKDELKRIVNAGDDRLTNELIEAVIRYEQQRNKGQTSGED